MYQTALTTSKGKAPQVGARALLVIDDEHQIWRAVANAMRGTAERVLEAATAAEGLQLAATELPDLVVLDLGLPDRDGIEVCRELRRYTSIPIVVLSARHSEQEKVKLLEAGADDYITKPFSLVEFAARLRALLRRALLSAPLASAVVTIDGLDVDLGLRRVMRNRVHVHLTPTEWEILRTLVSQAGRTLTHGQIIAAVRRRELGNAPQYLRVHITNLRRKIETDPADPRVIITEPGVGYRAGVEP